MRRRVHTLLAVAVVVASGAFFTARTGESNAEVIPPVDAVTLPTGDRVSPAGGGLAIKRGKGRDGMRFVVQRTAGATYVIPVDALAQIREGELDRAQFSVGNGHPPSPRQDDGPRPADGTGFDLTVTYLGQDGAPAHNVLAGVVGLDHNVSDWPVIDGNGVSVTRLPAGRYTVGAFIDDEQGTSLLTRPVLTLDRDISLVLDARAAGPVTMSMPEPSAALGFVEAGYTYFPTYLDHGFGMAIQAERFEQVRIGQVGDPAPVGEVTGTVAAQWARPDGAGDFADSPYLYTVAEAFPGRVPTGFAKRYRAGDFAAVQQRFAAGTGVQAATRTVFPAFTPRMDTAGLVVPTTPGTTRVEYHAGGDGVRWHSEMELGHRDGVFMPTGLLYQQPTEYRAGQRYRDEWNAGPAGPVLAQAAPQPWQWASRTGDRIDVDLPLRGDRAGHAGWRTPDGPARTALFRDGTLVAEFDRPGRGSFTVPPQEAGYRLEASDPRVTVAWTFRSAHVDGGQPVRLPLSAIRFVPALDPDDSAPAGRPFEVPVVIEGRSLLRSAEVSYDGGTTWTAAPFRRTGTGWCLTLRHPAGARTVSLRATAGDPTGPTVEQTTVDAYRLR